jgi:hypothetical protein
MILLQPVLEKDVLSDDHRVFSRRYCLRFRRPLPLIAPPGTVQCRQTQ